MMLAFILAILVSLVAYAFMGGIDLRLRIGLCICIFIGVVAVAMWVLLRFRDDARPGSVEVTACAPESDSSEKEM